MPFSRIHRAQRLLSLRVFGHFFGRPVNKFERQPIKTRFHIGLRQNLGHYSI